MNRRRFLSASTAPLLIAGCLSSNSNPGEPNDSTETTLNTTTPEPGARSDAFTLGEATDDVNPHRLTVRNDGDTTRTVGLQITDTDTDEVLLNESYAIDGGGDVAGELHGPAEYEVQVRVPAASTEHITTVDYFDTCNDYDTTVTVAPDETLSSRMMKTDLACRTH